MREESEIQNRNTQNILNGEIKHQKRVKNNTLVEIPKLGEERVAKDGFVNKRLMFVQNMFKFQGY